MNVMVYGAATGEHDWIPERGDRAYDDDLYQAEGAYNDAELARLLGKSPEEIKAMPTSAKRESLMNRRKEDLAALIQTYYRERGWNASGIPTPAPQGNRLWGFSPTRPGQRSRRSRIKRNDLKVLSSFHYLDRILDPFRARIEDHELHRRLSLVPADVRRIDHLENGSPSVKSYRPPLPAPR